MPAYKMLLSAVAASVAAASSGTCFIVADAGSTKTKVYAISESNLGNCDFEANKIEKGAVAGAEIGGVKGSLFDNAFDATYLDELQKLIHEGIRDNCNDESDTPIVVRILGTGKFRDGEKNQTLENSKKWKNVRKHLQTSLEDCGSPPHVVARSLAGVEETLFGYTAAKLRGKKCNNEMVSGFSEMGGQTAQFGYRVGSMTSGGNPMEGTSLGMVSWNGAGLDAYLENWLKDNTKSIEEIREYITTSFAKPITPIDNNEGVFILQGGGYYYPLKESVKFYHFVQDWLRAEESGKAVAPAETAANYKHFTKNITLEVDVPFEFEQLETIVEAFGHLDVHHDFGAYNATTSTDDTYYTDAEGSKVFSPLRYEANPYARPTKDVFIVRYHAEVLRYAGLEHKTFVLRKGSGWATGAVHQLDFGGVYDDVSFH